MQRFALIGAGFIGAVHAQSLAANPDVDFRFVYDVDRARAEKLAASHGAAAASSLEQLFDAAEVDAVLIASSTNKHADHLRLAADAGIAALCEKPIDLDLERARETVEYVEESGITAMVDFNRRFDRDYAELKRTVDAGEIGTVELLQLSSRGPSMPPLEYIAVSGGQMRDQTVHFFDLATWITGLDAVAVYATGSALAEPRVAEYGDVDTSIATVRLANGALVQIDSIRRSGYGYDERIEVFGSEGLVEAKRHPAGQVARYGKGVVVGSGMHAGWFERVQPTYAAALAEFVAALEGGRAPSPSLRDALRAQAIAEAATRSLASGREEPVE
ncbi:oxidoreductase [Pseudoclavibacter sp. RFBI5]|uniref:Gfo/Idh/MocA family oxidoreductase n=1 Tax=Pseudoclavibacter sp. RFBI5 TaxID=2080578 RepID=UPI000CE73F96|nr:Gfo/Idh/MocA family oxidoreductase [Pseudoclavibacter sp. RFBI5]PPG00961.1 oxidoreductase [Pseudoclavibacter sp. RFBI5]